MGERGAGGTISVSVNRTFGSGVIGWTTSWPIRLIDSKMKMAQTKLSCAVLAFRKNLPPPASLHCLLQLAGAAKGFSPEPALFALHLLPAAVAEAPVNGTNGASNGRGVSPGWQRGWGMWAVQTDGNSANCRDPGCTVSQTDSQTGG